jgi:ubiquitin carboxyl-terminal hydrolase 1
MFDKQNFFTFAAFPSTSKENISKEMQNIRPNLLDPMSLHVSYTGSGMGLITPPYSRMDMNGEVDIYDRERPLRLEPSSNEKTPPLPPVATLLNLGNTCFLNSVLYTLRFTPGFAHLLHHLATDLTEKKLLLSNGGNEKKMGFLSSGSPGLRTKSLSSLTPCIMDDNNLQINPVKRKTLVLTERLHELLQTLHNAEQKGDLSEPFQADAFLQALRDVNPLFQGNQQQDAHELLVCSLDYLREACQLVDKAQNKSLDENTETGVNAEHSAELSMKRGKQNSEKKKKSKKMFPDKEKDVKKGKRGVGNSSFPNNPINSASDNDQLPTVDNHFLSHQRRIIDYICSNLCYR